MQDAKVKNLKGSTSFVWAFIMVTAGLLMFTWMWTITDNARIAAYNKSLEIGNDADRMQTLNSFWGFAPIAALGGFAIYVWVMGKSTRGGGYVGD